MLDGISMPYHSLLVVCHVRNTPINFQWCSGGFLMLLWIQTVWQSLSGFFWFVNGVFRVDQCWFVWTELLISWHCRLDLLQRTISKQVHILLCPIHLSFPLPLVSGGLEGRLKCLQTLIKSRFWEIKAYNIHPMGDCVVRFSVLYICIRMILCC